MLFRYLIVITALYSVSYTFTKTQNNYLYAMEEETTETGGDTDDEGGEYRVGQQYAPTQTGEDYLFHSRKHQAPNTALFRPHIADIERFTEIIIGKRRAQLIATFFTVITETLTAKLQQSQQKQPDRPRLFKKRQKQYLALSPMLGYAVKDMQRMSTEYQSVADDYIPEDDPNTKAFDYLITYLIGRIQAFKTHEIQYMPLCRMIYDQIELYQRSIVPVTITASNVTDVAFVRNTYLLLTMQRLCLYICKILAGNGGEIFALLNSEKLLKILYSHDTLTEYELKQLLRLLGDKPEIKIATKQPMTGLTPPTGFVAPITAKGNVVATGQAAAPPNPGAGLVPDIITIRKSLTNLNQWARDPQIVLRAKKLATCFHILSKYLQTPLISLFYLSEGKEEVIDKHVTKLTTVVIPVPMDDPKVKKQEQREINAMRSALVCIARMRNKHSTIITLKQAQARIDKYVALNECNRLGYIIKIMFAALEWQMSSQIISAIESSKSMIEKAKLIILLMYYADPRVVGLKEYTEAVCKYGKNYGASGRIDCLFTTNGEVHAQRAAALKAQLQKNIQHAPQQALRDFITV